MLVRNGDPYIMPSIVSSAGQRSASHVSLSLSLSPISLWRVERGKEEDRQGETRGESHSERNKMRRKE
jgi:hypothetical protein